MLKDLLNLIILGIFAIILIIEVILPIVFFVYYLRDISIFIIEVIVEISRRFAQKFLQIKIKSFKKLQEKTQAQDKYIRYEMPFIVYFFPFIPVLLIAEIVIANLLHIENELLSLGIAALLYIIVYFAGMVIKYIGKRDRLEEVLNNNETFLKLSFLPFAFLITVGGFYCTITGSTIFKIWEDFSSLYSADISTLIGNIDELLNDANILLSVICFSILLYLMSLPIQVLSYFAVMLIKYFAKYGESYIAFLKKLRDKCIEILHP